MNFFEVPTKDEQLPKTQRTIDKIITKVSCKYGAPMGRDSYDDRVELIHGGIGKKYSGGKVYDCKVPMSSDGAYDKGGAYWGQVQNLELVTQRI